MAKASSHVPLFIHFFLKYLLKDELCDLKTKTQREYYMLVFFRTLLLIQSRIKEEHALQEVLYKTLLKGVPTALPPRSVSHKIFSMSSV